MIVNEASPFDILASSYDTDFTISNIGRLQRAGVWSVLQEVLSTTKGPLRILDINCGTGEDALRLAELGHTVIAADASAAMIEKAREKSSSYFTHPPVDFVVCSFHELPVLFVNEQFDMVFSNFGGLNCINAPALGQLTNDLASLIKPGGHLFFVIMSPGCVWEIFYYAIRGKFRTALRRFRKSVNFTVLGRTMPVYYYSPGSIKKIFGNAFSFLQQCPVGLFVPPSYLEKKFERRPRLLERLYTWEKRFGSSSLSVLADHYCITFKKPVR